MYATKFNTKGASLSDIINQGSDFFKARRISSIQSKHYEMAFTTNNGKHTYISFKTPRGDSENAFKPKNVGWKYTKTIKDDVYATTQDGQKLFKVGHNILRTGIDYINNQFIDKETGEVIENPNLRVNNKGQVIEYKEYISNYKVLEA
jgi:hypothetical protein